MQLAYATRGILQRLAQWLTRMRDRGGGVPSPHPARILAKLHPDLLT
jgi:hypothetical protein